MVIYVSFHWMPNSIHIYITYQNNRIQWFSWDIKMGKATHLDCAWKLFFFHQSWPRKWYGMAEFLNQWMESRHIKTLCSDTPRKGTADALVYLGIDHPMIGLRVLQKMTRTVAILTQTVAILTHTWKNISRMVVSKWGNTDDLPWESMGWVASSIHPRLSRSFFKGPAEQNQNSLTQKMEIVIQNIDPKNDPTYSRRIWCLVFVSISSQTL